MSHRAPIYYVDLTVRTGSTLTEAIAAARELAEARGAVGFDQKALDEVARQGFADGAFEESAEDGLDAVEQFYPQHEEASSDFGGERQSRQSLHRKLQSKTEQFGPTARPVDGS